MALLVKRLGEQPYAPLWQAMREFTRTRQTDTPDEIWLVQHPPVYTLGLNGSITHLLNADSKIDVIKTDRGGQITYHGPGQLVLYPLLNLRRNQLKVRQLITALEESVINLLSHFSISAHTRQDAPGVYITEKKIASLGLKVHRQCTYHGIALNVAMDLSPFKAINPCGFQGLEMTQLSDWVHPLPKWMHLEQLWVEALAEAAHLPTPQWTTQLT